MPSRDAAEHRRRVLEHQAKVAAEKGSSPPSTTGPQLKIPLIGEVRLEEAPAPRKRKKPRTRSEQSKLQGL